MNRINFFLLSLVIILLLGIGAAICWRQITFVKPYYAVYTSTGEIYFGEMSFFPRFVLKNAYLLQHNPQDSQSPYSIEKFSDAFWGPENELYLNSKNIVWKTKLKNDSQVLNFIKNPQAQKDASSLMNNLPTIPEAADEGQKSTSPENKSATSTE